MAQALTILALPILTRLYSPDEFSTLAVYVAILTTISVIACLRLDIAIPLPEEDQEAANVLGLGLIFATISALLTGVLIFFFGDPFFAALGQKELQSYWWLLPFGVWLAGSYGAFQFWATRKQRFVTIARTRMMQAGSGLTAQLGLGWMLAGPVGLLLGHTLMAGAGMVSLAKQAFDKDGPLLGAISFSGMRQAIYHYRRFPQYSTFEALTNNAAIQLPVILIAALAIGPEAGFLLLATRAMGAPVTLIGGAVSQVYLSRAPDELRKGRLPEFTAQILKKLAQFSILPLVVIAMIAPVSFSLIFGEEWRRAGELVVWMTPWFIMKLLSSPLSMVMHIRMLQRRMLVITIFGLCLRVGMVVGAHFFLDGFESEAYAVAGFLFYTIAAFVFARASGLLGGRV